MHSGQKTLINIEPRSKASLFYESLQEVRAKYNKKIDSVDEMLKQELFPKKNLKKPSLESIETKSQSTKRTTKQASTQPLNNESSVQKKAVRRRGGEVLERANLSKKPQGNNIDRLERNKQELAESSQLKSKQKQIKQDFETQSSRVATPVENKLSSRVAKKLNLFSMVKKLIIAYLLVLATVLTFFLCHYLSFKVVEDWRLSRFFLVNIVTKSLECFGSHCPKIPKKKTAKPLETPFEKKVKSL